MVHEVICADDTVTVIDRKKTSGESLWRVSSTCFSHIASDHLLQPLGRFASSSSVELFPPVMAGEYVR